MTEGSFAEWDKWTALIGWAPNPEVAGFFKHWREEWEPRIRKAFEKAEKCDHLLELQENELRRIIVERGKRLEAVTILIYEAPREVPDSYLLKLRAAVEAEN